jgi:hypothetical protein
MPVIGARFDNADADHLNAHDTFFASAGRLAA